MDTIFHCVSNDASVSVNAQVVAFHTALKAWMALGPPLDEVLHNRTKYCNCHVTYLAREVKLVPCGSTYHLNILLKLTFGACRFSLPTLPSDVNNERRCAISRRWRRHITYYLSTLRKYSDVSTSRVTSRTYEELLWLRFAMMVLSKTSVFLLLMFFVITLNQCHKWNILLIVASCLTNVLAKSLCPFSCTDVLYASWQTATKISRKSLSFWVTLEPAHQFNEIRNR